jgi:hypothetical protein
MGRNKDRDYLIQLDELTKENRILKRQLRRMRKMVDGFAENMWETKEEEVIEVTVTCESFQKCACGGDLKKIPLLDYVFEVCQLCKRRKRIK